MRFLKFFLGAIVVLAVGVSGAVWWLAFRPMPQTSGEVRVPGLQRDVIVRRDSLGIPHIQAQSLPDLYFAQGWVTAQDRLWQMDVLRRLAGGTLAEIAGQGAYRSDADKRMLGTSAIAAAAAKSLPPDQRRSLEAYAAGVNAFISANQGRLPMEFRLMGYRPSPWRVEDSLLVGLQMFEVLTTTWRDELFKMLLLTKVGENRTAELLPTRSDRDHPPADEMTPTKSTAETAKIAESSSAISAISAVSALPALDATPGSNNWVVSGAHTASGRAMLANDPHLDLTVPSIWYSIHLQAPGMNVAGVSLPGMAAVVIGHNEKIAWGMTNLGADVQDLYIEKFDPKDRSRYMVDGQWQQAEVRHETVHIKNAADRTFDVIATRHGPIILSEDGHRYTLHWVAADRLPWSLPFFGLNQAANFEEFRAALADFPGPGQNFVYADTSGNIGYQATGKIPIRGHGDGSVPLPGEDSANDWKGYIPFDQLPRVYNPPSGMIATANGRVVPDGYPYPVATKWETPDRTERIYALLKSGSQFRADDFSRIQTDVYSEHYQTLGRAFAEALEHRRPQLSAIAQRLRNWDGQIRMDSSEASIVHFARFELLRELLEPRIGAAYLWYRWRMGNVFLERLVHEKPAAWIAAGVPDFDEMLAHCVDESMVRLGERFQTRDPEKWPWGDIMKTSFAHPLADSLPGFLHRWFAVGPFELAGNPFTVKQTTMTLGPSMRLIVDFANLDDTRLTLTMGESGQPLSPHFSDQFQGWYTGRGLVFPFSESAVNSDTRATLRLEP